MFKTLWNIIVGGKKDYYYYEIHTPMLSCIQLSKPHIVCQVNVKHMHTHIPIYFPEVG